MREDGEEKEEREVIGETLDKEEGGDEREEGDRDRGDDTDKEGKKGGHKGRKEGEEKMAG
jgi:hypothetical protein